MIATAPVLSENDWHRDELLVATKRFKANKSADEKGFVAELLRFAFEDFLDRLLESFNGLMHSPQVPIDWRKTIFKMLPKHGRAKVPAEYRLIASIRFLYKTFAYMIFFSPSRLFSRDKVSESCFTGQLPGIGTFFILASLQMCKIQRQSPLTNQGW